MFLTWFRSLKTQERIDFSFLLTYVLTWASYIGIYIVLLPNQGALWFTLFGFSTSSLGLGLFFLRQRLWSILVANFAMLITFAGIMTATGGFTSNTPIWDISIVVTTFLLLGIRYGVASILVSILTLALAFFLLEDAHYGFPFDRDSEAYHFFIVTNYMMAIPLTGLVSYLFANFLQNALRTSRRAKAFSDAQARQIKAILDSINQGVFAVAVDTHNSLYIEPGYSQKLHDIVAKDDFTGTNPMESIFGKLDLNQEQRSIIENVLASSLNEDALQFEANRSNLPREADYGDRSIEIEWSYVTDLNDRISRILVVLRDVTEMKGLRNENLKRQKEIVMLVAITNVSERHFSLFIQATSSYITEIKQLLEKNQSKPIINECFRNMHTIKGLARNYGFRDLSELAHRCETSLQQAQYENPALDVLMPQIEDVAQLLGWYKQLAKEKLGRDADQKLVNFDVETLSGLVSRADKTIAQLDNTAAALELSNIVKVIKRAYTLSLEDILYDDILSSKKLCKEQGKGELNVQFLGESFFVNPDVSTLIKSVFLHLMRNSVDHGLEEGKAAEIYLETRITSGLEITYWDSGKGLDCEKIRAAAIKHGFIEENDTDLDQILATIFQPGLSTKEVVTDISGRGIGMDAVVSYLERNDGRIEIVHDSDVKEGQRYVPFKFVISLPMAAVDH